MGDIAKSPFFPILLLVVVVVQFQTLYLKNRKRYRSEMLHTSKVQYPDVQ